MWTKHFSFFIMRRSTPKMGSKHFSNLIQLSKLRNLICYFIGYFFFIYSEVSDALLIQSQYWKGSQNIVELFQYWSLNHLCFSAHSTFVSQHPPPLLRKVQKIQLCYFNSSVMRVRSNTFGDPIFQKGLQNQPSSPIMSVLD